MENVIPVLSTVKLIINIELQAILLKIPLHINLKLLNRQKLFKTNKKFNRKLRNMQTIKKFNNPNISNKN